MNCVVSADACDTDETAAALAERYERLMALLERHALLWRPAPFQAERPAWCALYPALTEALLALDDEALARLSADAAAVQLWLAKWLPDLSSLSELLALSATGSDDGLAPPRQHFGVYRGVPGRKAAQIDAFAQAVGPPGAPFVELCAGKGHLGRRLLAEHGGAAVALELDPRLCAEGEALSRRQRVAQGFVAGDVHADVHASLFVGRHVLALHACGDLHRRVLTAAVAARAPAIDLAPCCYQKSKASAYQPFASDASGQRLARLGIDHNILHLTVSGLATARPREARIAARQQAWKLAFVAWRGKATYQPFMPVPAAWWQEGFAGFFVRLVQREGLDVSPAADFASIEAEGWRRWAVLQRLQLVRFAFRRAIEVVLLLDMARYLQMAGYQVRVRQFCSPQLTPRNLLLSARLL